MARAHVHVLGRSEPNQVASASTGMVAVEPLGPKVPWESSKSLTYGAYGKRHVLILFSEVPGSNCPEAVARRDGHLI